MLFNLDKVGKPLAVISEGKYDKKIVSVSDSESDDITKTFQNLSLSTGSKFQQIPNKTTERTITFITGPSGSGKSTYVSNYLKQYKKAYKQTPIYVFSGIKEDEVLDDLGIKRVKIDDELITSPLTFEDFNEGVQRSCLVFDDIDLISNKKQKEAVYNILNQTLQGGRHLNQDILITNHLPTAGKDTRIVLCEAHAIVYFPHSGSARQINYLLQEYCGLDKKDIKKIKNTKSRWACIFKNYPQVAMTERNIFLLGEDDE